MILGRTTADIGARTSEGLLRSARYAFGPNRLHYCGPDRGEEIRERIADGIPGADEGLADTLRAFETLYPYLGHIARSNGIADPFDPSVVEAYWIGNRLLDRAGKRGLFDHLAGALGMRDVSRVDTRAFLGDRIFHGALPHHSFHVLEVWARAGEEGRTAELLGKVDRCRVSWGAVEAVSGPFLSVARAPLVVAEGMLSLGEIVSSRYVRELGSEYDIEQLKPGDLVSIHWDVVCEKITPSQEERLRRYTLHHLAIVNRSLNMV